MPPAAAPPLDHDRFADVLQRHAGLVRKVAHSYTRNAADRADLAQEIALQLWRAWPAYDPARTLSTWMYRIALNVAISHVRNETVRNRHAAEPLDDRLHDLPDGSGEDPDSARHLQLLQTLIARQPPLDRALLLLYLDERSQRDIADILGISETNVSTRIGRLKQRLRDAL